MRSFVTFLLTAAAALVCVLLLSHPVDASVSDLAGSTAAAAIRAGSALSGDLPSFWQASVTTGRREAARRIAALGYAPLRDVTLTSLTAEVTGGQLACMASRLAGFPGDTAEDALLRWRDAGFVFGDGPVPCGEAAVLVWRILGYPLPNNEVGRLAAWRAVSRTLLIDMDSADDALTFGDAALLFFRALDTTDASGAAPADRLAAAGQLENEAVATLLRESDVYTVDSYLWANGLLPEGPDGGYYTIALAADPAFQLNALMSKENSDTDGLAVPLWNATGDSSQTFRFERQEDGSYLVYCAASKGGYNRVLGLHKSKHYLALYKQTSSHAMRFLLRSAGAGLWYFLAADDPTLCLTVTGEPKKNAKITLETLGTVPEGQVWSLSRRGARDEDGAEIALFPALTLRVTQGAFDVYSHEKQNAIDLTTENRRAFAPFTAKIVRIDGTDSACNAVWIESCEPVRYADGSLDYMTLVFMHDNSVRDLSVGQILMQGQYFYDMGTAGNAAGSHIHVAVIRGQYQKSMKLTGSGDVFAEDAFFLLPTTEIVEDYGLPFRIFVPEGK